MLSAMFIIVANSWMQHPVGYKMNIAADRSSATSGRVRQPDVRVGVRARGPRLAGHRRARDARGAAWYLRRQREVPRSTKRRSCRWRCCRPRSAPAFVGNRLGEIENTYQPMKIAAAEAQWENCKPCSFSLFQIGGGRNDRTPSQIIEVPNLLSVLATNSFSGGVTGLNQLQRNTKRNTVRATTCPTYSSSTGRCGSWPIWRR